MTIRFLLKFIFLLPGTVLHELAHYMTALVLGRAEGFSVWPRKEGNNLVFGRVKSKTRYKVLSSFISIAPLFWWVVLIIVLRYFRVIGAQGGIPAINFGVIFNRLKFFSFSDILLVWFLIQILWAGRPSVTDIKNFFGGFFSVSGFLFLSLSAGLIYLIRHFALYR